ncbi:MAG TPA: carboxypeptidase regulatory-like domain-containing protein, partial [Luteitalea sp.]|nr:carboxypeptidase regulatory-like domain-containing protein [Luteitalea sp.]
MQWRSILLASTVCVVASAPAVAQQTVGQGSISGRVTDESSAVIVGADVRARHLDTNLTTSATTDNEGRFRLPYLRVGEYELRITGAGFAAQSQPVVVAAGSAFDFPVTLRLEGLTSGVTVSASAPVLEAARSQIAATVAESELRRLPLNGRQFLDVALLAPGVTPPNINSTQLFAETSAVPGVGLSIGGQRNLSNSVVVDGMSANDDAAGLSGMPYGVDAIEQVQVVTSGAQAELGRAIGGYVSVVTRSGTNDRRGSLYGFFRDDALNARNALSRTTLPMSQQQYGGSLGGPLRRDRTFFFANAEQRLLEQTGLTTIAESTLATVNARLAAVGYPGTRPATGTYVSPVDTLNLLGKVDHVVSNRLQLGLRYSLYDVSAGNARGAGGLSAPSASSGLDNRDHAAAATSTFTLSSRTVNEARVQYTDSALRAPSTDTIGPAVAIAGVATFGTFSSSPQGRFNRMLHVVDNLSQQR